MNSINLIQTPMPSVLNRPGERVLMVQREHPFLLFVALLFIVILGTIFEAVAIGVFSTLLQNTLLLFDTTLLVITTTLVLMTKVFIDWQFHLYILTNHKLLELSYKPLFSQDSNEVIMEEVRCTEVDVKCDRILNELLDIGNVVLTFDRPTHEEEFVIPRVRHAHEIATVLSTLLDTNNPQTDVEPVWHRIKNRPLMVFRSKYPEYRMGGTL